MFKSIRARIIWTFAVLVLLNLASTYWSIYNFYGIATNVPAIIRDNYLSVLAAENMMKSLDRQDNALLIFNSRQSGARLDGRFVYFDQGVLIIMAATAASRWSDWQVIHLERGPWMNEMLGDPYRWQEEGVLSVLVQASPAQPREPTALRILDFAFVRK